MSADIKIKFLGAAETVTGSSYLVELQNDGVTELTIMVDHGMFQGPDVEIRNTYEYSFSPSAIDYLLLTHAHIDHCGLLPRLVNRGFSGPILCTGATSDLVDLQLLDSAKVQQHQLRDEGKEPLYVQEDSYRAIDQLRIINTNETYDLVDNMGNSVASFMAYKAGHVLGAVSYKLTYRGKTIVFSGDIGRRTQDVIPPFDEILKSADYVVCESLYGGKFHQNKEEMLKQLALAINQTISQNGNVIIPAFALQRTQELLFTLTKLVKQKLIPADVPIFLDSPLAFGMTKIYLDNLSTTYASGQAVAGRAKEHMLGSSIKVIRSSNESKKIKRVKRMIVISGSGMCNGGRVVGYLKAMLGDPKNLVLMVGFQAEQTLGRELISGSKSVIIDDEVYPVVAKINHLEGFSAHADQNDLLAWLSTFDKQNLKQVLLVHSEIEQAQSFESVLQQKGYKTMIPKYMQELIL